MTSNPIRLAEEGFRFKIRAANYHLNQISINYVPGETKSAAALSEQFFYYTDAFLFEAYSASDLTLQYINVIQDLGLHPSEVRWSNRDFRDKLKVENKDLYDSISSAGIEPWFKLLSKARESIAHHGMPMLEIDVSDGLIRVMTIKVIGRPVTGKSIDIVDEGKWIVEELENAFAIVNKHLADTTRAQPERSET